MNPKDNQVSRRELLKLASFAAFLPLENAVPAVNAIDHLLLGVANREEGIAWVEKKTGVKAVIGGSHPGVGTCNALLSLGGRQYLEIIAPDPAQQGVSPRYAFLKDMAEPRLITWAAKMQDAQATVERFRAAAFEVLGPSPGARNRPDGKLMKWTTVGVNTDLGLAIPFFIEWDVSVTHPAEDSSKGCRLESFELTNPRSEAVRETLRRLGIDAKVKQGAEARLEAIIKTPKGAIRLT